MSKLGKTIVRTLTALLLAGAGYRFLNFCLDEPGGSGADNLALQTYACNDSIAQHWSVGFN